MDESRNTMTIDLDRIDKEKVLRSEGIDSLAGAAALANSTWKTPKPAISNQVLEMFGHSAKKLHETTSSLAAAEALNKSSVKMASELARSFEKSSLMESMKLADSLRDATEKALGPLSKLQDVLPKVPVLELAGDQLGSSLDPLEPTSHKFDTSLLDSLADDKKMERDAYTAMIEMAEVQQASNEVLGKIAEIQRKQSESINLQVEVLRLMRSEQKQNSKSTGKINVLILFLTAISVGLALFQSLEGDTMKSEVVEVKAMVEKSKKTAPSFRKAKKSDLKGSIKKARPD